MLAYSVDDGTEKECIDAEEGLMCTDVALTKRGILRYRGG